MKKRDPCPFPTFNAMTHKLIILQTGNYPLEALPRGEMGDANKQAQVGGKRNVTSVAYS